MVKLLGIDIGGTKCAVILGEVSPSGAIDVIDKVRFCTSEAPGPEAAIGRFCDSADELLARNGMAIGQIAAIGVSCGGPLDSKRGVILSPPNLPGWDDVRIVERLRERYGVAVGLQNDANACAVAEWQFGAGRGCRNMVFLTFGTGMGAGLILDGKLYAGTNDNAGEIGHVRMASFGPVGFGKAGSFEGFCSGSGLAQLGRLRAQENQQMGRRVAFWDGVEPLANITAARIAGSAQAGDEVAKEIFRTCGEYLGRGLAILTDVLNPERIVLGSIYVRAEELLLEGMNAALSSEGLPGAVGVCRIVPAELSESIGDVAALSVAYISVPPKTREL